MNTKTRILRATLAAAAVLIGAQAYAHTVAFFTQGTNFRFSGPVFVPLTTVGATTVTFTGSGRKTIIYTAECSNSAADTGSWVTIVIFVDGVELAPTAGTTDAFCTSNGVA
jgi:hypothetical protein